MTLRDLVGGYPDGPGSEEVHRPAASRTNDAARPAASLALRLDHLLGAQRFRLQAAGLATFALIVALVIVLPARDVRIIADGDTTTVSSRAIDSAAIVEQAGVDLQPGDRVETASDDALVVRRATEVTLQVDGQTFALRTQAETIRALLLEARIPLASQDSVLRNGAFVSRGAPVTPPAGLVSLPDSTAPAASPASDGPVTLEVRRAVPFVVIENGHELQLRSSRETVAAALRDVGVRLAPGDAVQPTLDSELTAGTEVHVDHAAPVVVTLPETKVIVYTLADAVGDALAESGVGLPADYRLEPPADTPISAGLAVHVVGISHEQELETLRVESYTVYEPDPSLPRGATRVSTGQDGVLYRRYAVEYQDGALVSRELAEEWYDPQPVDTIIYYSTAQPSAPPVSSAALGWAELTCSYDWDCDWALAVIQCESGGNPNAYNPAGYVGLFQIWQGHASNLTDPATNIAAAYSLYLSGGAGNWPNCP